MPEKDKISKRDAQIECIELDEKFFKVNPGRKEKIRRFLTLKKVRK